MKCRANDVVGDGVLEISCNSSSPRPFGLDFKREPIEVGNETLSAYECGFNLTRGEAKKLALYILENL